MGVTHAILSQPVEIASSYNQTGQSQNGTGNWADAHGVDDSGEEVR